VGKKGPLVSSRGQGKRIGPNQFRKGNEDWVSLFIVQKKKQTEKVGERIERIKRGKNLQEGTKNEGPVRITTKQKRKKNGHALGKNQTKGGELKVRGKKKIYSLQKHRNHPTKPNRKKKTHHNTTPILEFYNQKSIKTSMGGWASPKLRKKTTWGGGGLVPENGGKQKLL